MHVHSANKSSSHPYCREKSVWQSCGAESGRRIRHVTTLAPSYLSVHQYEGRIGWCFTKPSIQIHALICVNESVFIVPKERQEHHFCPSYISFLMTCCVAASPCGTHNFILPELASRCSFSAEIHEEVVPLSEALQ